MLIQRILNKIAVVSYKMLRKARILFFSRLGRDTVSGKKIIKLETGRLGTSYCGWTIPKNVLDENSVAYLVGAGEDISFDCEIASKYKSRVFIVDPTPRAISHFNLLSEAVERGSPFRVNNNSDLYNINLEDLKKLSYLPVGIWSENGLQKFYAPKNPSFVSHAIVKTWNSDEFFEAECKTLKTLMNEYEHKKIDLLKLDVEGAEYEIIDSILKDNLDIKVICVEFDEVNFNKWSSFFKIRKAIRNLLAKNYKIAFIEGGDYTFVRS